jgi:hypothetical protein
MGRLHAHHVSALGPGKCELKKDECGDVKLYSRYEPCEPGRGSAAGEPAGEHEFASRGQCGAGPAG